MMHRIDELNRNIGQQERKIEELYDTLHKIRQIEEQQESYYLENMNLMRALEERYNGSSLQCDILEMHEQLRTNHMRNNEEIQYEKVLVNRQINGCIESIEMLKYERNHALSNIERGGIYEY